MNKRPQEYQRIVCWFSCGAASAAATKIVLNQAKMWKDFPPIVIVYEETGSEHPDNERFLRDCEHWFGQKIERIKSEKYADTWDVWEKTRYLVGVNGARCTSELKRIPAEQYINHGKDLEVFGYTPEEKHRVKRWKENNDERAIWTPLIDAHMLKGECLGMLAQAGIDIPEIYKLGFRNNNCIPCPKASSMKYWSTMRKHFRPEFERMAKLERDLDVAINKRYEGEERIRVFLDELPEDAGKYEAMPSISCGLFCQAESDD